MDMKIGTAIGLVLIFIILSGVFSSYSRPLIVMSIIPFAALGSSKEKFLKLLNSKLN